MVTRMMALAAQRMVHINTPGAGRRDRERPQAITPGIECPAPAHVRPEDRTHALAQAAARCRVCQQLRDVGCGYWKGCSRREQWENAMLWGCPGFCPRGTVVELR